VPSAFPLPSIVSAMAARTVGLLLVAGLAAADAAAAAAAKDAKEAKSASVVPSDILFSTGSLIYDIHLTAYEAAAGLVMKHGIHTQVKEHSSKILGDDWVGSVCAKVGCNKKDIMDKLNQAQAAVQQAKAQAYEYGAKASDLLNGFAATAVAKVETFLPKYKDSLPKNFLDLALIGLYFAIVAHYLFHIGWFCFRKSLSIFCCVCCCGCCRGSKSDSAKKGKNSGKADAKATPKQAASKAKGTKK